METKTPAEFVRLHHKYVYRSHKGKETVQWREAALELDAENARFRAVLELIRDSWGFNGGTSVSELQGIASEALAKAHA